MQYISIIRFFEYSGIAYDAGTFQLARAKKLVAAEFAMQADGIIAVDGYSYTRQDILSELERPDFAVRLPFHQLIWDHKDLLDLLEKDTFESSSSGSWFALHKVPGFVPFIAPFFSVVYNRIMRSFLNANDLSAAAAWLDYLCFVDAANEEEAVRNTRIYLNDVVRFFRNLNDASFKSRDSELRMWYTTSWSTFINKLPDSLLSYVDEVVSAIINFTVRIQKSGKKICYKISKELLKVNNANYSLIQLVRSNHEAYTQNYKSKTLSGWLRSGVNIVYVIMIAVFAISRLFLGNSDFWSDDASITKGLSNQSMELVSYKTVRNVYRGRYSGYADSLGNSGVATSGPFNAGETYLLIEAANTYGRKYNLFTIKNNTQDTLEFHTLRDNYISHFTMEPGKYYSFRTLPAQSIDLFCELGNTAGKTSIPFRTEHDLHFLHVCYEGLSHDWHYGFNDDIPTEMPYMDETELSEVPMMISVLKKGGKYYFDLKGGYIFRQNGGNGNASDSV